MPQVYIVRPDHVDVVGRRPREPRPEAPPAPGTKARRPAGANPFDDLIASEPTALPAREPAEPDPFDDLLAFDDLELELDALLGGRADLDSVAPVADLDSLAPSLDVSPGPPPSTPPPSTPEPVREATAGSARPPSPRRRAPLSEERLRVTGLSAVRSDDDFRVPSTPPPEPRVQRLVRQLAGTGPTDHPAGIQPLLEIGAPALEELLRQFPGLLWFDRNLPHVRPPRGRDVSAVSRAIVAFGPAAASAVERLLRHPIHDIRYYAALIALDLGSDELLPRLSALLFDPDGGVRETILAGLAEWDRPAMEHVRAHVRAVVGDERQEHAPRLTAMRCAGVLRDPGSVPALVELLDSAFPPLRHAAHRVLLVLTGQDFGGEPKRWRSWARKNRNRPRLEWLIEGLGHHEERVRAIAHQELVRLTGEGHGFVASMDKRERKRIQKLYRRGA